MGAHKLFHLHLVDMSCICAKSSLTAAQVAATAELKTAIALLAQDVSNKFTMTLLILFVLASGSLGIVKSWLSYMLDANCMI